MAFQTMSRRDWWWYDQAVNVEFYFPDTTPANMIDGVEVLMASRNFSSNATITIQANPSSPNDKIINPNDRDAAIASSFSGLVCKGQVWVFVLKKTNETDPLWYCHRVEDKL